MYVSVLYKLARYKSHTPVGIQIESDKSVIIGHLLHFSKQRDFVPRDLFAECESEFIEKSFNEIENFELSVGVRVLCTLPICFVAYSEQTME